MSNNNYLKPHLPEEAWLGVELGSTRIKAVLIGRDGDNDYAQLASGSFDWENRFENGVWTYRLEDVWTGMRESVERLADEVRGKYGASLSCVSGLGVSAMMHGYLVFDGDDRQLAEFRTWRNTTTEQAAAILSEKFRFNIPQRWSVAHIYQAILNGESHVGEIASLTTLAGYVHYRLTGRKVVGVGEASGMFPVDSGTCGYRADLLAAFDGLIRDKGYGWKLEGVLPEVLAAGADAGTLTAEGALLLDPAGALRPGIPLCPPEGDAGTGMVATNSVAEHTGNVSAGTSIFAMVVLDKELSRPYPEIDMVTTPAGKPVAMVHANNCTSDLDAWFRIIDEAARVLGADPERAFLYDALCEKALEGDPDCGGVLSYNYFAGEPVTGLEEGRPLLVRTADSAFTLANFVRSLLFSTLATLKIGMDILTEEENVQLGQLLGHGGLFKIKDTAQRFMASALGVPVATMESAGVGGAWGIALLAAFRAQKEAGETLEDYLEKRVFRGNAGTVMLPDARDSEGFREYMKRYTEGIAIERAAVGHLK